MTHADQGVGGGRQGPDGEQLSQRIKRAGPVARALRYLLLRQP